jgi:preprotein translocase SecE subunit
MQENTSAYRYALGFYLCFAAFFWYAFHGLGLFIGTHYTTQSASGFSVVNPDFYTWNNIIATALSAMVIVGLLAWGKLKEHIVDVGDEMTRVSFADLKDTRHATLVVCALVVVSSIFLFAADYLFLKIVNAIMNTAT